MMVAHRKEMEDTLRLFARYVNVTNDYTRFLDYYRFF